MRSAIRILAPLFDDLHGPDPARIMKLQDRTPFVTPSPASIHLFASSLSAHRFAGLSSFRDLLPDDFDTSCPPVFPAG